MRGEAFSELWPTLGKEDKQWLVSDLADIVARMHAPSHATDSTT